MSIRVIVTGGRAYADHARVFAVLDALHAEREIAALANGAAKRWDRVAQRWTGADYFASQWARANGIVPDEYEADWDTYRHLRINPAGPIRNARMLADFAPDVVVAFPGGRGTADMVAKARAAGVEVVEARAA